MSNEGQVMKCSLCLYVPRDDSGTADEAVTVINGQAVCYHHMGYVGGGSFARSLSLWREAKEPREARPEATVKCYAVIKACADVGEHSPACTCKLPDGHTGPHMSRL